MSNHTSSSENSYSTETTAEALKGLLDLMMELGALESLQSLELEVLPTQKSEQLPQSDQTVKPHVPVYIPTPIV